MRIAVIHDYLTQLGGAERVVQSWVHGLWPESISTLVWDPETVPAPRELPVFTTRLQMARTLRRDPRLALPLLPAFARRLPVPATCDVVLISSSGFAHNVRTAVPKVVYWHTPARWLYAADDYRLGLPLYGRTALRALRPYLIWTDRRGVASTTVHLCNSHLVQKRLQTAYGVHARVVHPPVVPLPGPAVAPEGVRLPERFFLNVARSRGYKNTRLVLEAARRAGVAVVTVGGRPIEASDDGRHIALGAVPDAELKWLYGHAEALVSASREDFGLTPLEANLEGTPALVPAFGGFLETVVPGVNGSFFRPDSVEACASALREFRKTNFDTRKMQAHAEDNFSLTRHVAALRDALLEARGGEAAVAS
jgi:glycosyltransferase involved in cell wall biosynthesis